MSIEDRLELVESRLAALEGRMPPGKRYPRSPKLTVLHVELVKHHKSIRVIKLAVGKHYNVSLSAIDGNARPEFVAWPRQVAMVLVRRILNLSLNTIGGAFGGRDHGTVRHAIGRVADEMNPVRKLAVAELEQGLRRKLNRPAEPIAA